jgi:hypothetical protein
MAATDRRAVAETLIRRSRLAMFRRPMAGGRRQSDGALGRSQAVRQRILIPPCGGSNPPAPANQYRWANGRSFAKSLSYPLIYPCRFDTLQSGPTVEFAWRWNLP